MAFADREYFELRLKDAEKDVERLHAEKTAALDDVARLSAALRDVVTRKLTSPDRLCWCRGWPIMVHEPQCVAAELALAEAEKC